MAPESLYACNSFSIFLLQILILSTDVMQAYLISPLFLHGELLQLDTGRPVPIRPIQYIKGKSLNMSLYLAQVSTEQQKVRPPKTFNSLSSQRISCGYFKKRFKLKLNFFYSKPMKVLSIAALGLLFSVIRTAAGISCGSQCAACWKIGQPGVDIKIACDWGAECHNCPPDYDNIHCAKSARCQ